MKLVFDSRTLSEHLHWQAEASILWFNRLTGEYLRRPFTGTGKPEPLKRNLSGRWSRRVNRQHRLVNRLSGAGEGQALELLSCRFQDRG